jgi:hypothetical protein
MEKEWIKPMLTVVIRGPAEENVLSGCKYDAGAGGPYDYHEACYNNIECNIDCEDHALS